MITIYLTHSLSYAPPEFFDRMFRLRERINAVPGLRVLEFNFDRHKGPNKELNSYSIDMNHVDNADLMIAIRDFSSEGGSAEIERRLARKKHLALFYPRGKVKRDFLVQGLEHHRSLDSNLPFYGPMEYDIDGDILVYIVHVMLEDLAVHQEREREFRSKAPQL